MTHPTGEVSTVLAVCTGERCSALTGAGPGVPPSLRSAAGASHRGVLVSTPCLRACHHAPVVALGRAVGGPRRGSRSGDAGVRIDVTTWLGPVGADEVVALSRWLFDDGAGELPDPLTDVLFDPRAP